MFLFTQKTGLDMIKLPIQGCERYSHALLVENPPVPVVDDYIKLLYPHTVPTKSSKIHYHLVIQQFAMDNHLF